MPSQFDNLDPASLPVPLRSQRMTADEAKAVIDRWQSERFDAVGVTDRPAVPDVAEGLDIGVEDVQRLLAEVRERRAEEERGLAYEQELAEIRLAEEERKLAEVRRQRAELRRVNAEATRREPDHWQRQAVSPRLRRGKRKQALSGASEEDAEGMVDEDFWQETEEDKEFREVYRADKVKKAFTYALYGILLLLPIVSLAWLFFIILARLGN